MPAPDTATLQSLADDLGDAEVVRDVVATYLTELPGRRAEMAAALDRGDAAGLRAGAHRLGSASALVGAHDVAAACRRIELHDGRAVPGWAELVAEWDRACADAAAGLRAWLAASPG